MSRGFAEEEATLNFSRQDLAGFVKKPSRSRICTRKFNG